MPSCHPTERRDQNPLPPRHMILNELIALWCQYSIFRSTASICSVTEHDPKPVSVIEINVVCSIPCHQTLPSGV